MSKTIIAIAVIALAVLAAAAYFILGLGQMPGGTAATTTTTAQSQAPTTTTAAISTTTTTVSSQAGGAKYTGLGSDVAPSGQQTDQLPSNDVNIPPV